MQFYAAFQPSPRYHPIQWILDFCCGVKWPEGGIEYAHPYTSKMKEWGVFVWSFDLNSKFGTHSTQYVACHFFSLPSLFSSSEAYYLPRNSDLLQAGLSVDSIPACSRFSSAVQSSRISSPIQWVPDFFSGVSRQGVALSTYTSSAKMIERVLCVCVCVCECLIWETNLEVKQGSMFVACLFPHHPLPLYSLLVNNTARIGTV